MDENEVDYFTEGYKEGYKVGYEAALLVMESNIETLRNEDSLKKMDGMLDFVMRKQKRCASI